MQLLEYIIAVDFKLTCWEVQASPKYRRSEIIEFPAILMHLKSGKIEAEFRKFIRPSERPTLSTYCTNLTGITQETVNNGISLQEAFTLFEEWLRKELAERNLLLGKGKNCALVTWSSRDFGTFLPNECERKCLHKPTVFNQWIDLRVSFEDFYGRIPKNFKAALAHVGLAFSGREHSGLNDARNLAALAHKMVCSVPTLEINKIYSNNLKWEF